MRDPLLGGHKWAARISDFVQTYFVLKLLQCSICIVKPGLYVSLDFHKCLKPNLDVANQSLRLITNETHLSFPVALRPNAGHALPILEVFNHTQRSSTVGRTSLDEWLARRRDLYLTTHNTHKRQTSMSLAGFEPTIAAGERPQTHALDSSASGIGNKTHYTDINDSLKS
jgi:hypothetical protein